ncbi:hypothetical protein BpHYR1_000348 [Brachionus plicatilis]|uniref:Uncharacterized protein n=1 Tax=Brachionus plicatilis TaxID=10195 RepID=A0A3M7SC72_BRAPC|nr:hypothetical protein BpHYR1_000348 [Brachionus plicatilis]
MGSLLIKSSSVIAKTLITKNRSFITNHFESSESFAVPSIRSNDLASKLKRIVISFKRKIKFNKKIIRRDQTVKSSMKYSIDKIEPIKTFNPKNNPFFNFKDFEREILRTFQRFSLKFTRIQHEKNYLQFINLLTALITRLEHQTKKSYFFGMCFFIKKIY